MTTRNRVGASNYSVYRVFATVILNVSVNKSLIRVAAIASVLLTLCYGDMETIEFTKIRKATALEGIVTDQTGTPTADVRIAVMSDDWKTEFRSTTSDAYGHWAISASEQGRTYRLQFVTSEFNSVRIRVKITTQTAKPLVVVLPVAT